MGRRGAGTGTLSLAMHWYALDLRGDAQHNRRAARPLQAEWLREAREGRHLVDRRTVPALGG
jgi:hypothetical protein